MLKKSDVKVAPSLLAADFSSLVSEIKRAERAGADMLHVDVMDGHFVKNITFGPFIVRAIRKVTRLPLIAHLMIENPKNFVEEFVKAGSDMVIFHIEATENPKGLVRYIKGFDKKAGVSIKPKTKAGSIASLLPFLDEVLVMTVEPGFGGQKFMQGQLPKIREIRARYDGDIAVDGGINCQTARLAAQAGANVFVAGTYLFGSKDMKALIGRLKSAGKNENQR